MSVEKAKSALEAENVDLANELKSVSTAKQESERKRKQLEVQVQEHSMKIGDLDRQKSESSEKATRLQVIAFSLCLK